MSNIAKGVAAPVTITLGEHTFTVRPWRFQELGEFEAWAADQHMQKTEKLIKHMPDVEQQRLRSEAFKIAERFSFIGNHGDASEEAKRADAIMAQTLQSVAGIVQLFYLSVRQDTPDVSIDELSELLSDQSALEQVSEQMSRLNNNSAGDGDEGSGSKGKAHGPKRRTKRSR